jgi:hypothetical protein
LPELKKGDLVEITINDQNLLVDVHKASEASHHRVVRGQLAEPMPTGSCFCEGKTSLRATPALAGGSTDSIEERRARLDEGRTCDGRYE